MSEDENQADEKPPKRMGFGAKFLQNASIIGKSIAKSIANDVTIAIKKEIINGMILAGEQIVKEAISEAIDGNIEVDPENMREIMRKLMISGGNEFWNSISSNLLKGKLDPVATTEIMNGIMGKIWKEFSEKTLENVDLPADFEKKFSKINELMKNSSKDIINQLKNSIFSAIDKNKNNEEE